MKKLVGPQVALAVGVVVEPHRVGRHRRQRPGEVAAHELDHVVGVALVPDGVAALVEVLAADLQVVRAAREVVLEEADRAGVLVAPPLQQPVAAAAEHLVAVERLVAGVGGVADQPEVVAELAGPELGEHVLADGAVPLALVDPAGRVLQGGRVGGDVDRRAAGVDVGAVGLLLGAVLQVADELVVLVHLVAELAGVVEQLGVERRAVEEAARGRRRDRVALVQVREVAPEPVA